MRIIPVILLLMIISLSAASTESFQLKNIKYYIAYDPLENKGLLSIVSEFLAEDCSFIYIPVNVAEAEYMLLNYSVEGNAIVIGVNYNSNYGYLDAFICGSGVLTILLTVDDLFKEVGLLSYFASIDTSIFEFAHTSIQVEIIIHGNFTVLLNEIGNVSAYMDELNKVIKIQGYGQVDIVLMSYAEEPVDSTITTQYSSSISTMKPSSISIAQASYTTLNTTSTSFINNTSYVNEVAEKPFENIVIYTVMIAVLILAIMIFAYVKHNK